MPKYVEVGSDVVEFPDNMSDAQIEQALAAQFNKPQPPTTKAERKPSIWEEAGRQLGLTARAGATGLASIPMLVAEPVAAGINALAGRQVFPNQSEALQQLLTQAGLPEPRNRLERAVQTGASSMAGAGSQAAAAARSGVQALVPLTQAIPQQLVASGAAGTTAQATSEKASELGFSPEANLAATLASGTLAGLVGAKSVRSFGGEKTPQITMDQVKQEASRAYNRVDSAGVSVKPLPVLKAIDEIEQNLYRQANFNPQLPAHKDVDTILQAMKQMVGQSRVSFTKLDQMRQTATTLARESKEPATRRLASFVVDGIDKKITSLQPEELMTGKDVLPNVLKDVKEARDAWKRMSKASVLEDALNVAEARALAPTASEGELIRNQFKALAASKDKMRLFTKEEQTAIRRIVSGSDSEKILALAARFNPERSQMMLGGQLFVGTQAPKTTAAIAAGGFAADKALAAIQRRAAQDVVAQILSGRIKPPPDNASWRALVEAQAQSYGQSEQ